MHLAECNNCSCTIRHAIAWGIVDDDDDDDYDDEEEDDDEGIFSLSSIGRI